MAGINVKQQIIQEFTDSFGNEIHEGDLLLLSTKKAEKSENILCVFKGTKGQYLVTSTVGTHNRTDEISGRLLDMAAPGNKVLWIHPGARSR